MIQRRAPSQRFFAAAMDGSIDDDELDELPSLLARGRGAGAVNAHTSRAAAPAASAGQLSQLDTQLWQSQHGDVAAEGGAHAFGARARSVPAAPSRLMSTPANPQASRRLAARLRQARSRTRHRRSRRAAPWA